MECVLFVCYVCWNRLTQNYQIWHYDVTWGGTGFCVVNLAAPFHGDDALAGLAPEKGPID